MKEHFFRNVDGYSAKYSIFVDAERKYHEKVYNIFSIFWAALKLLPTSVTVLLFWSALSNLVWYRSESFVLPQIVAEVKKCCSAKITKKCSAEQKPKSKLISLTRVQVNNFLVASQRVMKCELRVYHIASQQVMSQSHRELPANKLVSCKPASLWVANLQVNNLQSCESV